MANNNHYSSGNITFVQADPSNFRTIVQRLTGATLPRPGPPFKLHERRQTAKKLEIQLIGSGSGIVLGSPVSPFDLFASPRTPPVLSPVEEEERAIAGKGFYLHPSPRSTVRGPDPELLPLFPVCSARVDPDVSTGVV